MTYSKQIDKKLLELAWGQYRQGLNPKRPPVKLSSEPELTNVDRTDLLEYLGQVQVVKSVSMAAMKRRIFDVIGLQLSDNYVSDGQYHSSGASPVNRAELQAIMHWIEARAESKEKKAA